MYATPSKHSLEQSHLMDQLKGSLSNGNIGILEAVNDGGSVSLNWRRVNLYHLSQGIERHVTDIVVPVRKEPVAVLYQGMGFNTNSGRR